MKSIRSTYIELNEFLDERPNPAADFKWVALLALAGYLVTLGVRLLEVLAWDHPAFFIGDERILATHDAYCWLAGAKGINEYAHFGMARLAALLAQLTGAPLWSIGFWAPAFLGSLTAVATCLWAWLLAGRRAAILPAMLGALSPGFFYRSRLGYYDSDVFTQLMPLLLGFCLAALISHSCSRSWLRGAPETQAPLPGKQHWVAWLPWLALGFGLLARVAHSAHDDIHPLGIGLYWLALGLVALAGLPGQRVSALRLLIIYGLAAYAGPRRFGAEVFHPGLAELFAVALAAGTALLVWKHSQRGPLGVSQGPDKTLARRIDSRWIDSPWPWLAALVLMTAACGLLLPFGPFWAKVLSYFKPVADASLGAGAATGIAEGLRPIYPGITQSIREAKNVADWIAFFSAVSVSSLAGAASLVGLVALLLLRPAFLLLVPMTILGLASLKLGSRFAMFAGPVCALGLGIGMHWLGKALQHRFGTAPRLLIWAQVLLAAGFVLLDYAPRYAAATPTPVLAPSHAEALVRLKSLAPKDAEVWTWWDFGYATQYFSERMTPSDGGKHGGRDIFATALVLTTPSYRQAAQLIQLSASQNNNPARRWDTMSALDVKQELNALKTTDQALPTARPQHLVVCWENLTLFYWISYYGSWDVVSGHGAHAGVMLLNEPFSIDRDTGTITLKRGDRTLPLASAEIVDHKGLRQIKMPENTGGLHLLVNEPSRQALLLDDMAYSSMAVQLLLGNPDRPEQSRYFKLLHEGFPLVRIYEVLPPAKGPAPQAKAKNQ